MTLLIYVSMLVGSGKSSVAEMLKNKGAAVIDADKCGHEWYIYTSLPLHKRIYSS